MACLIDDHKFCACAHTHTISDIRARWRSLGFQKVLVVSAINVFVVRSLDSCDRT